MHQSCRSARTIGNIADSCQHAVIVVVATAEHRPCAMRVHSKYNTATHSNMKAITCASRWYRNLLLRHARVSRSCLTCSGSRLAHEYLCIFFIVRGASSDMHFLGQSHTSCCHGVRKRHQ